MAGYAQWFEDFADKHRAIVKGLDGLSGEEVVAYFDYDNMRRHHPDFCPLYREGIKCHDIEELNCYLCACPLFRFCDAGIDRIGEKIRYSFCAVDSRWSATAETETAIHQDCSECSLPHRRRFIEKCFDRDWREIMREVQICEKEKEGKKKVGKVKKIDI